jgi:eukaryotic-like serine/threonine-protein kinase
VRLAAHERLELDVALTPGDYVLRGPKLLRQQTLRVRSEHAPSDFELPISQFGVSVHTPLLRSGRQAITLVNDHDCLHVVRLERQIARDNVVTASVACTLPRFRELFPDQTFDRDTPIVSDDITLFASGLNNVESLYVSLGDADAYRRIRQLIDLQHEIIVARGGTVAKSIGEGLLAAFRKCDDAVSAAIEIQDQLRNDASLGDVSMSIALHRGQVLITTQNDRLDYFGAAVRLPQAMLKIGAAIAMTDAVFADAQTRSRFASQFEVASLKSVEVPGHGTLTLLCTC